MHTDVETQRRPRRGAAAPAGPHRGATVTGPALRDFEAGAPTLALAMALQPQGPGQAFHAAIVTAQGQQLEFSSLSELVNYLVRVSLIDLPPEGLR